MNGLKQAVLVLVAMALRVLAWVPLGIGRGLASAAEWCEREARR